MKVIIDRFEGKYAVCEKEDRSLVDIEKSRLPKEAKDGDVLHITKDGIVVDKEETRKRKDEIEKLTKDLWN